MPVLVKHPLLPPPPPPPSSRAMLPSPPTPSPPLPLKPHQLDQPPKNIVVEKPLTAFLQRIPPTTPRYPPPPHAAFHNR